METLKPCASCGHPVAADVPRGLCPACLMKVSLSFKTGPEEPAGLLAGVNAAALIRPPLEELARGFPQVRPGVDMARAVVTQNNSETEGESQDKGRDRRHRILELLLVVLLAFGIPILHSVYALLRNPGVSHTPCRLLRVVISLIFLGYVLCRKRRTDPNAVPVGNPQDKGAVVPFARVARLIGCIRQVRLFEWWLVVLVAFWRPVVALAYRWLGQVDYAGGLSGMLVGNVRDVPGVLDKAVGLCVLGYVLHRRGSAFSDLGLRWSGVGAALALPLFLLGRLLSTVQWPFFYWLGQTFGGPDWHPPDIEAMIFGSGDISIAMPLDSLLNGFFEEVIVRAFVMTEVIKLTQRTWLAVVVSVSLQTSYHFYQGVPVALSHVALFTLFALFYAKTRSILPVALAHSLNNLSADWGYGLRRMLPY